MFHLALLLTLQQPAPAPAGKGLGPSPVARIVFLPAELTVVAGDSVRLRGEAQDAAGKAVAGARIPWARGSSGPRGTSSSRRGPTRPGPSGPGSPPGWW